MRFENIILDILRVLPKSVLKLIAGPPLVIDGNQLDLNIQVAEKLSEKEMKKTRITTHDYREAAKRFDLTGLPRVKKIKIKDIELNGPVETLKARIYYPKIISSHDGAVLFFHQGGLVLWDHLTNDYFCSLLADKCDAKVISLDYRLCPENEFPAPIEDCLFLWDYVQENSSKLGINPNKIALAGDSAGGMISSTMSIILRDRGGIQPIAMCIAYPWVTSSFEDQPSLQSCADTFPLSRETVEFFNKSVFPDGKNLDHRWANPLYENDLTNLPPTIIATAGFDPIRDQGNSFAEKLINNKNEVKHHFFSNLSHSFLILGRISNEANRACIQLASELAQYFDHN